jgi:hypothetical protein
MGGSDEIQHCDAGCRDHRNCGINSSTIARRLAKVEETPSVTPRLGQLGSSGGVGGLGFVPPTDLSVQEQLDRYPRNAIPYFRNFSVGIPPHLQNGDVFPSLTSVRHPVGDVAHDKSTVGAASWSRTAARWHAQPRLVQGRQRESLQMRLVAFLATASRGGAAITIVYRLYGER